MTDIPAPAVIATPALPPRPEMPWQVLPALGLVVLLIFAGALIASCYLGDDTLRTQMFTGAYGLATLVLGYFFGSAIGSKGKDATIAAMAAAAPATTNGAPVPPAPATP